MKSIDDKNDNLISVVIPCFNSESYIQESINSVLSQTYRKIELIVIDDGSTDDTLKVIKEYEKSIVILRQENQGAASARNLGIHHSKGDYIALLDSDDVWMPDKLEKQMKIMSANELDLVYCGGESLNQNGPQRRYTPIYWGNCYQYFVKNPTKAVVVIGCSGALFRKSILDRSGYFDQGFVGAAEDWDFFRRFSRYGLIGFSEENLVKYRHHSNSISNRHFFDFISGNFRAIKKMLHDDDSIRFSSRARIWIKFSAIILKSALKESKE
jgi:glycosyltransferase involved in cell wall biosynthesis